MEDFPYPIRVEDNGNWEFSLSVLAVLTILHDYNPQRYQEAITYLPRVRYDPNLKSNRHPGKRVSGRSDGSFSLQGYRKVTKRRYMGEEETEEEKQASLKDFRRFFWVYLHEVGHNLSGKQYGDWSEVSANRYADLVMEELRGAGAIK